MWASDTGGSVTLNSGRGHGSGCATLGRLRCSGDGPGQWGTSQGRCQHRHTTRRDSSMVPANWQEDCR